MEDTSNRSRRCLKATRRRSRRPAKNGLLQIVAATHAGMTIEDFTKDRHRLDRDGAASKVQSSLHRIVYQPMLELLAYLRANGFKTFIVSGGGIEFMRPWTERVYGIPPEQVVGSSGVVKFEIGADGKPHS